MPGRQFTADIMTKELDGDAWGALNGAGGRKGNTKGGCEVFHCPHLLRKHLCVMLNTDKKRSDRCSQRCAERNKDSTSSTV